MAVFASLVHQTPSDARRRLAELNVSVEAVVRAVLAGHTARLNCTDNDPPFIPGTEAWRFVVRTLRDELLPLGWRKDDPSNYSLVINDSSQINIVVASSDAMTCMSHGSPRTKSRVATSLRAWRRAATSRARYSVSASERSARWRSCSAATRSRSAWRFCASRISGAA